MRDPERHWLTQKGFFQRAEPMFFILKYTTGLSATLPGFHLFRKDTKAILNKKPMGIHNEWARPNSFPWCEIVLSTCNHWWLCNDKKHPHAFLIDPSSLKARKSLYASDQPSLETWNNVGATLEMLMSLAEKDSVNKTHGAGTKGGNHDWVCQGQPVPGFIIHLIQRIMRHHICILSHPQPFTSRWLQLLGLREQRRQHMPSAWRPRELPRHTPICIFS